MINGKIDPFVGSTARPIAGSLLVAGALFCLVLMSGHAQTVDANTALTYSVEGNSVTITDCDQKASGALVIPSTYEGKPVTSIKDRAFESCSRLRSVTIPDSVTSIGDGAFLGCSSLTNIGVVDGNSEYTSQDGVLFDKNKTTLIQYLAGKKSDHYSIPDSVTSIGGSAFSGCSSLTSVTIPDSVTSIGNQAFWGCRSLTSVTIPDSVTSIGRDAFSGCSSLKKHPKVVQKRGKIVSLKDGVANRRSGCLNP